MPEKPRAGNSFIWAVLISLCLCLAIPAQPPQTTRAPEPAATATQLPAIRRYIKEGWRTLSRSNANLAQAAVDPKFKMEPGARRPVYVSRKENVRRIEELLRAQMPAADFALIEVRQLPDNPDEIRAHGLLYLPHPYVVPGGRFNEMYGWDSYFIQVGLLRDNEIELARHVTDNFLYQIEHYGKILNANRTYYLTRSQPPFLTRMILDVYRRQPDREWLRRAVPAIEQYYRFWNAAPHLTEQTGLARYYSLGRGPAAEVVSDERDAEGRTHYDRVKEFYRTQRVTDYDVSLYYDRAKDELTDLFYVGDRSMRESGFDPSNRFGPFNIDIIHYNPVCLNSLLYLMERDAAEIMRTLNRPREATVWQRRAAQRRRLVNRLMWDEQDGLYYDYNFREQRLRRYPFVTTFYPLWAGIASPQQAARVVSNLHLFELPGGLQTSTNVSGSQWDAPFGWAPMQLIAIEGLRRYGYHAEADRITANFLSLILKEFAQHKTIVEKYDVARRESEVAGSIKFGYDYNVIGFGWTNAAFVELYSQLPAAKRAGALKPDGVGLPQRRATNER